MRTHGWSFVVGDVPTLRWHLADDTVAAVSTRIGGVSSAPYDTLNLGRSTGDADAHIDENRRRFLAAIHAEDMRLARIHQVHGTDIVDAADTLAIRDSRPRADGLITREAGQLLVITVADCAPVFIVHPESGTLAAVHAGWRGTAGAIARRAAAAVAERAGVASSDLRAAIGPSIGPCCYEVGPEVAGALPDATVSRAGRDTHRVGSRWSSRS